ncbi:hypothetical protein EV681_3968 [Advenella incenata]|uniref:Uncharacterized protein n=1 Tax=Advenella incenata TaxID=267800 RepID=A0A4Q7V960_9BURK|nr:hypothetical protein [Advenella incenata]RZT92060.1 hypothetical protein EV681_3968 [Advenella incenata]
MKPHNTDSADTTPAQDPQWEIDGAAMYRAVSFAVALPSFMIGTALFMLGFSLSNSTVLHIACILYSLSLAGFTSRVIVGRRPWLSTPPYIACIVAAGLGFYVLARLGLLLLS